jgi:hypothetical protein
MLRFNASETIIKEDRGGNVVGAKECQLWTPSLES